MTQLWLPSPNNIELTELTLKLEAIQFERRRFEQELKIRRSARQRISHQLSSLEVNIQTLRREAKIVSIREYSVLLVLRRKMQFELNNIDDFILQADGAFADLDREIQRTERQMAAAQPMVLQFRKK